METGVVFNYVPPSWAVAFVAGLLLVLVLNWMNKQQGPVAQQAAGKVTPDHIKDRTVTKGSKQAASAKAFEEIPELQPTEPEKGNLGDILAAGSLHQFLEQLHRKHGEVVKFWWMTQPVLSVASPQAFKDTSRLPDRPGALFLLFQPLFGEKSIQYANGEDFASRKSSYRDKPFSHAGVPQLYQTFVDVVRETITKWKQAASESKPLVLQEEMMDIGLKTIVRSSLGFDLKDTERIDKIREAYEVCWSEMESRLDGSFPGKDSQRELDFKINLSYLQDTAGAILQARRRDRKDGDANEPSANLSFIDYLVEADVPEQQALADVITFLVGGFHTTGYMLTWAFYFLMKHSDCMQTLQKELQEVLGNRAVPTLDDISKLTYLNQVISETLRCSVLAPWAARYPNQEIVVAGYKVPAGTPIIQALGVSLHDPQLWPEPKRFQPERFSPTKVKGQHTFAFVPFGFAGKRICPGQRYAKIEGHVMLAALLQCFSVCLEDPALEVTSVHGLVTCPDQRILFRATERQGIEV